MYATILTAAGSLSEPGLSAGIVFRMRMNNSLVGRLPQALRKFAPFRGGASKLPLRSG
jgi:hypothetical protein